MMFDVKELPRFRAVGKGMKFDGKEPRRVRLEVLAEDPAKLYVSFGKEQYFIGKFDGYDVVQFAVPGEWSLSASGPVKVWSTEFDRIAHEEPEAVSFAKAMTRRERNPELERMMQTVQQTMERRLAKIERDQSLREAARDRLAAAEREAAAAARREEAERNTLTVPPDEDSGEDEPAET